MDLAPLLKDYRADLRKANLSENSIQSRCSAIRQLEKHPWPERLPDNPADITQKDIEHFLSDRDVPLNEKTRDQYEKYILAFVAWCKAKGA